MARSANFKIHQLHVGVCRPHLFPLINGPTDKHGDPVFKNYQELNANAFSGSVQKERHTKGTQSVACKDLPIHTKSYQDFKSFKTIQRSPLTMYLKL